MVSHLRKGGDDRAPHSISLVFAADETNLRNLFPTALWPAYNSNLELREAGGGLLYVAIRDLVPARSRCAAQFD